MKVLLTRYTLIPLLCMLAACQMLGLEPAPKSFEGKLSAAYTLNTSIRDGVDATLNSAGMSSEDAQKYLDKTRDFRSKLDAVKVVAQTDLSTAEQRLALLDTALKELRDELASKGVAIKPAEVTP